MLLQFSRFYSLAKETIPLNEVAYVAEMESANNCLIALKDGTAKAAAGSMGNLFLMNEKLFSFAFDPAPLFRFTRRDYSLERGGYKETPMFIPTRTIADVTENIGGRQSYIIVDTRERASVGLKQNWGESGFNARGGLDELKMLNPAYAWPQRPAIAGRPAAKAAATPA